MSFDCRYNGIVMIKKLNTMALKRFMMEKVTDNVSR